jgi:hypothetical protein
MKTTKRVLCILLALALGLCLFAPALAADGDDPRYAPRITQQPNENYAFYVKAGNDIKLEVKAALPDGVEGTLSYAWYDSAGKLLATTAKAVIPTSNAMLLQMQDSWVRMEELIHGLPFYVVVTNTYYDEDGVEQTASTESEPVTVTLVADYGKALSYYWTKSSNEGVLLFLWMFPISLLSTMFNVVAFPMMYLAAFASEQLVNLRG